MAIRTIIFLCLMQVFVYPAAAKINADQFAIIVNTNDSESREIAAYYQKKRNIPEQNLIEIALPLGKDSVDKNTFMQAYQKVKARAPDSVQYYVLAWTRPFKVGCMSVTSAFAFGFDQKYCAKGCKKTATSLYYNSDSQHPGDELQVYPTMMLAGSNRQQVFEMIDRGVMADGSQPQATAYLLSTSDRARNVRSRRYPVIKEMLSDKINIELINADVLSDKNDVMFYFTGMIRVKDIESNTYLPGAITDHLTSFGGRLTGSKKRKQMSILRWLDAGATASYGTAFEPCAFTQKFPNPGIVIDRYLNGESLIEAYWKSVAWPGQGVFVGEPMATPYATKQ